MKTGRCIRCTCVKKGLPCTDCWPSTTNPVRCQNLSYSAPSASSSEENQVRSRSNNPADPNDHLTAVSCPKSLTESPPVDRASDCTATNVHQLVSLLSQSRPVLKRIPRLSRITVARKLAVIINEVVSRNNFTSLVRLLQFPKVCLFRPRRAGKRWKLSSLVNNQVSQESGYGAMDRFPNRTHPRHRRVNPSKPQNAIDTIVSRVSSKLEEADYRGAVRLVSSEDIVADHSEATLEALREKHPPPHSDSSMPKVACTAALPFSLEAEIISKAIMSFPNGSSGGKDGLLPQHLKDLTGPSAGDGGVQLMKALEGLITLILEGRTPSDIQPILFGASLIPLKKKCGGIRPIAVGCTFRRLASKCAITHALGTIPHLLAPLQTGFGVPGGVEAAVHACRVYLNHLTPEKAILKVDFENAFNSIRRDKILGAVERHIPDLLPFVHSAYSSPSNLQWDDVQVPSAEGIQQGDPIGPLLFCITIHDLVSSLQSEFNVFYLDDGTIGGTLDCLAADLRTIHEKGQELGLHINVRKSEVIAKDMSAVQGLLSNFPGLQRISPENAVLLGSPLGDEAMSTMLKAQLQQLKSVGDRLSYLQSHDAITILRHSFAIPKLLHILRTSPAFKSSLLTSWDNLVLAIFSRIININLCPEDPSWIQATLPVKSGGLGIRRASFLAPSAFLASADGASLLMQDLLPPQLSKSPYPERDFALIAWNQDLPPQTPVPASPSSQKAWEKPRVLALLDSLLSASDQESRARLLAASSSESGAWLHAPPISSLGLRMSNDTVRVAVGLRIGAPLCQSHKCANCGNDADQLGRHGLSCRSSTGRISRHHAINNIILHSLAAAKIPSRLEPSGLFSSDRKRPDGVSLVPWSQGRYLAWDATCVDTFCPSNLPHSVDAPGGAAAVAEDGKNHKYAHLD